MGKELISIEVIENKIFIIRDKKVMLDRDLSNLYGVPTKVFNQAVKRNIRRFPDDFMFQLTSEEALSLRSHFVTSKRGGRRYLPYAFTDYGILMLSSVLNSERAIQVNIRIMRAFANIRNVLANNKELARKIELVEKRLFKHDSDIRDIMREIRKLSLTDNKPRKIGFGFKV